MKLVSKPSHLKQNKREGEGEASSPLGVGGVGWGLHDGEWGVGMGWVGGGGGGNTLHGRREVWCATVCVCVGGGGGGGQKNT